jgi:hypothetical protein
VVPTSKRKAPGEVRDAIVASLQESATEMSVNEIQLAVERRIGPVPTSSVRSYLRLGVAGSPPTFIQPARGHYRLAQDR